MTTRINEVLKERGITQAQLAGMLGVSAQYVSNCLSGKGRSRFGLDMLERVSNAIGVPLWQFFASPQQVAAQPPIVAFVKTGDKTYQADTLDGLKKIVAEIEEKQNDLIKY